MQTHGSPKIPYLDRNQMIEVDRAMVEDYSIALIQMMENAGRNLAHLARRRSTSADQLTDASEIDILYIVYLMYRIQVL
jgi:NAD(P)H-hydrate repair Nnr-like enzyme with NAD(P)H-hydrate epimerase domain